MGRANVYRVVSRKSRPRAVDDKRRVTLPRHVYEGLGLRADDLVTVELDRDRAVIRKYAPK